MPRNLVLAAYTYQTFAIPGKQNLEYPQKVSNLWKNSFLNAIFCLMLAITQAYVLSVIPIIPGPNQIHVIR